MTWHWRWNDWKSNKLSAGHSIKSFWQRWRRRREGEWCWLCKWACAAEFAILNALPAYTSPQGVRHPPSLHCTQHLVQGASFIMIIPLLPPYSSFILLRRKLGSRFFLFEHLFQNFWYWPWKVCIHCKCCESLKDHRLVWLYTITTCIITELIAFWSDNFDHH